MDASDEDIQAFYKGEIRPDILFLANAFGTYDSPGLFYIESLGKEVIGIEYRNNDSRINYPTNLQSIELDGVFFYSIEIENDVPISLSYVKEIFEEIAEDDDAHRIYSDLSIKKYPEIIGIFPSLKKTRILYECELIHDNAMPIINDDVQSFDSKTLYEKAFYDPITNHYNWNHLVAFLEMPMDHGIQDFAFVHFDVKEFRVINEVYGHIAANKVLCDIVKAMNESDMVYASARCHNDNFAMMIKDMTEEETLRRLTEFFDKLSTLDEDPQYKIYYRCGVVPMKRALISGNRVADAGKMAQALGVNHNKTDIIFYTEKMHDDILWGNFIKAYADTAIKNDEFLVYLQPKFDIHKEKIKGAEALIRWNYKKSDFLPPSRFIPFFEKDGTIGKIDDIVLTKVCEAFARWKKEGKVLYPISVNLSRNRLYDENIIEHLIGIIDSYGIEHNLIDFELTESATYDDTEHMIQVLNELRANGFLISMDDFGTGYSSFSLLTEMPIDTLKLDKSFVDKVGGEADKEQDIAVVRHIVSLAKELKFICLAEGAEKKTQVDKLRELGCDVIQGYYYSKPIPISEYETCYL
ncbi:MAG: GGDEF domain-containing phosphodiesterase [Lachnospiraceae bacterium]|nr:GGDEF domain-containing phosphodiesterase [Lachnospiraceae bacterium]